MNKRTLNGNKLTNDEEDLNDRPNKQRRTNGKHIDEDEHIDVNDDYDEVDEELDQSQPTQSQLIRQTQRDERLVKKQKLEQTQNSSSTRRTTTTTTTRSQSQRSQPQRQPISQIIEDSEEEEEEEEEEEKVESDVENHRVEVIEDSEEEEDEEIIENTSTEPESGIIESIKLENFMCHRHFEIKLGPNVNFISGVNGSGKSALLVALIICLGSKASTTNRGHKLTDLIKHDANQAIITVKLRNKGAEAYKKEKYGNSIIVERRISKAGVSGYKLKDETGQHTISDKLTELSIILEQFNIQIDNPMAILMQDTSRMFLNAASPAEKYKLFLTATQLDQMTKDYEFIFDHITSIKGILSKKIIIIEEIDKQVKEYAKEYEEMGQIIEYEKKLDHLKEKLAWAFVFRIDRSMNEKQKILDGYRRTMAEKEKKLADLLRGIENLSNEVEQIKQLLTSQTDNKDKYSLEKQIFEDKIREIEREQNTSNTKCIDLEKRSELFRKRVQNQKILISDTKRKNIQARNNQPKQQDLEKKQQELARIQEKLEQLRNEKPQKEEQIGQLKSQVEESTRIRQDMDQRVQKLQKSISLFTASKNDSTKVFGERIPELLNLIRVNSKMFSVLPIGPIGMNIKVKDEKWAYAIETHLTRNVLRNYLVASLDDGKQLEKLAQKVGMQIEYTKVTFLDKIYDEVRDFLHKLNPDLLPIINVLDINSTPPVVLNYLIDYKKVECVLLADDRQRGERILYHDKPQNVRDVFLPNGSRLQVSKTGGQIFIGNKDGYAQMIKTNTDRIIQKTKEELEEIRPRQIEYQKNESQLMDRYKRLQGQIMEIEKETNNLKRKTFSVENDIRTYEETMNQEISDDTSELEQGLVTMEEEMKRIDEQLREAKVVTRQFDEKKRPFLDEITSIDKKNRNINLGLDKLENQQHNLLSEEKDKRREETQVKLQIAEVERKSDEMKVEIDNCNEHLRQETEKATEYCPKVTIGVKETVESISDEIAMTQRHITHEQSKRKRSRQDTFSLYKESKEKLVDLQNKYGTIKKFSNQLSHHLNTRFTKWQRFRNRIANRTTQYFNIFLTRKGYTGQLTFDHESEPPKLDISVQLQKNIQHKGNKGDTKSLSGGERSFSTVSLLLALWEAMECPFRAMDEFDVFMDEVNRRISIDLLLSKAKENLSKQYIFVTPLSLNSIQPGPFVFVHKVSPPIRGQQTIIESLQHNS